jgi:ethanolamine-phosphate cytidylyltransferase
MTVIYVDMCGDIFHYGHVRFLEKAKQLGDILLVGIHSDKTIESYKRTPIFTMEERIEIVKANKWVTKVIEDAPLYITEEYIKKHNIDIIAIPSNRTKEEIQKMCIIPYNKNMLRFIDYTEDISTTKIIERIVNRFI